LIWGYWKKWKACVQIDPNNPIVKLCVEGIAAEELKRISESN
jgi:hypothetical protein